MIKVFLVEDDENIRDLVIYALSNAGFESHGYENSSDFFEALASNRPNIILLDIMLPDEDGISILNRLKRDPNVNTIPVIMLTAKSSEIDRVKGLDLGADDYISKPFSIMELISRIKAVLRRSNVEYLEDYISLNNIYLNYNKRIIRVGNNIVNLTYKEFELLYYLLKNKDLVLTREMIMNEVWGFDFEGETRTVDVHIATLRQKLGEEGNIIKTIRNVGYKVGI